MHTSFQVSVRKTRSRWLKSKIYHKFKLKNCKQIVQTSCSYTYNNQCETNG